MRFQLQPSVNSVLYSPQESHTTRIYRPHNFKMLGQAAMSRFLRLTVTITMKALTNKPSFSHLNALISSTPELMLQPSRRPPYLFRVHSSSSQESNSGSSIVSQDGSLLIRAMFGTDEIIQTKNQLLGSATDPPFLSTTSSLLWAMVHARNMAMLGEKDVKITLTAPKLITEVGSVDTHHAKATSGDFFAADATIQDGSIFAATDVAAALALEFGDRYWRDGLSREFLLSGDIPDEAILGSTTYEATATDIETLLVGMTGKPLPLLHESSTPCQDTWSIISQAMEQAPATSLQSSEYEAARNIANTFRSDRDSFPLTLMCLAFQGRNRQCLDWSQVIGGDPKDLRKVVEGARWISLFETLVPNDNLGYLHEEVVFRGKPELEEWKALMRAAWRKSIRG